MAVTKYLIPLVALAGGALAQCSNPSTTTVTAAADASALSTCTTYSGSIAIATDIASGQNQQLSISGIRKITNDLVVTNAVNLASLEFGDLQNVGTFALEGLTVLATLSMPSLGTVNSLNFTALPALQSLSFGNTGITEATNVLISNTGLSSLQGLNNLESVDTFNINNNGALQNISLAITSVKGSLDIEANDGYAAGLTTSFPQLQTAMNLTFRNCSSIELPSLANVSQDMGFYGNAIETFVAPNLTTVGGLIFVDNTDLTNISIPGLTSANLSFTIANNTQLKQVNGFPKLATVAGALDFSGNFTDVELPALTLVKGAFNLQTSAQFDCSGFNNAYSNKVIKGKYTCSGEVAKPGGEGSTPSTTGSSGPKKSNPASPIQVPPMPALVGGTGLLAGLLQLVL